MGCSGDNEEQDVTILLGMLGTNFSRVHQKLWGPPWLSATGNQCQADNSIRVCSLIDYLQLSNLLPVASNDRSTKMQRLFCFFRDGSQRLGHRIGILIYNEQTACFSHTTWLLNTNHNEGMDK